MSWMTFKDYYMLVVASIGLGTIIYLVMIGDKVILKENLAYIILFSVIGLSLLYDKIIKNIVKRWYENGWRYWGIVFGYSLFDTTEYYIFCFVVLWCL